MLRVLVGTAAAVQGGSHLASVTEPAIGTWMVGVLAVVSGVSLLIGFFTPAAGAVAGFRSVIIASSWMPAPPSTLALDKVAALFVVADAAALVLLGPGALSLDAWLFGRREIIIPHDSHPPRF